MVKPPYYESQSENKGLTIDYVVFSKVKYKNS